MSDFQDEMHDEPVDEVVHDEVGPAESTGHAGIDAALERLDRIDDLEITAHPEEFDAIHRVLRESLANAGRDGDLPEIA